VSNTAIVLQVKKVAVYAGVLLEQHVQVIRSKIGRELIQKWRDVQNEPI
jgi:hypothetical protein